MHLQRIPSDKCTGEAHSTTSTDDSMPSLRSYSPSVESTDEEDVDDNRQMRGTYGTGNVRDPLRPGWFRSDAPHLLSVTQWLSTVNNPDEDQPLVVTETHLPVNDEPNPTDAAGRNEPWPAHDSGEINFTRIGLLRFPPPEFMATADGSLVPSPTSGSSPPQPGSEPERRLDASIALWNAHFNQVVSLVEVSARDFEALVGPSCTDSDSSLNVRRE
ncbi:hypothetical protein C8R43DRAFT_961911 [Mycena crocata]|nr:hypothetical protein C8R43DRAFT_961911 [Mycena crocata]